MACFVFQRFSSRSCGKPALSASRLHAAKAAGKRMGQGCSRASRVVWPRPRHRRISQTPSLWLEKGSSCCLAGQLGAVNHPSPPTPCTAEVCDHPAGLHPTFSLPGSLGHSLGIPQQLQTLLGSREMLSAVHLFLPCKGQVRLGLALQCVPRIFSHWCLSFCRNNQC